MTPFRFRAAAALDLRRQQERTAAGVFARAEAALREVRAREASARRTHEEAAAALVALQCRGTDISDLLWHRNWIVRCADAIERAGREVAAHVRATEDAERAWQEARRRHLALERMRDRAWRRHQAAEHQLELKRLDELGRLRYVLGAAEGE